MGLLHRKLVSALEADERQTIGLINGYLSKYADYYGLGCEEVVDRYMQFVSQYALDLKAYRQTGRYPSQKTDISAFKIERTTYDVFLILSTLTTRHRFDIMHRVRKTQLPSGMRGLIVGAGAGLELHLLANRGLEWHATDKNLSAFIQQRFGNVLFIEKDLTQFIGDRYDYILAIELLEHFHQPFEVVSRLRNTLKVGGCMILTTARNVPQFDHLYNFSDPNAFELELMRLGLHVRNKFVIPHKYLLAKVNANNIWYDLSYRER